MNNIRIPAIKRIRPFTSDQLRERVSYALDFDSRENVKEDQYLFSSPYKGFSYAKLEYDPDSQLADIRDGLPLNHNISVELARQANLGLDEIIGKENDEIAKVYSRRHRRIIIDLGKFKPVSDGVREFAYQMLRNPVIDRQGSSESGPVLDAIGTFNANSKNEENNFFIEAGEQGIFPTMAIGRLSKLKNPRAIDFFIDYFFQCKSLESGGMGNFVFNRRTHTINFPFTFQYLVNNFGEDVVRGRVNLLQDAELKNRFNLLFDFYRK